MKPYVICHMISSLDGRLHPSRWSASPDGTRGQWSAIYQQVHEQLEGDAWLVGRVTMAEMTSAVAHPPSAHGAVERPCHVAAPHAASLAVALDPSGKLHFAGGEMDGDHIVVLLGRDVPDSHLAELASDGASYLVSETRELDLAAMLDALGRVFGVRRLLLEGGAATSGAFLAAGLVDELSLLLAPALDGSPDSPSVVVADEDGLSGKVQLSLTSCTPLEHGLVHLRYAVGAG